MKSIGIDIGTTTICGVVLDLENEKILYKETIENNSFINTNHEWERVQDVDVIISKAIKLLDRCLEKYSDIDSIGLTGQMHGIVYVDSMGKAISPLYTWQDQRGQLLLEDNYTIVDKINQYTLHPVASGYGLVTHAYHIYRQSVTKDAVKICTIMDYLGMVLTQRKLPLIHVSNAMSLGFWNTREVCFELDALNRFNVNSTILPEVTEEIVVIGNYHTIPVLVALGDNQASFLSTVGNMTDSVLVNLGTGGQVSLLIDEYVEVEEIETRPFIDGKYLLVGASLCGGRAYAILEKFLRQYVKAATGMDKSQYEIMEKLARQVDQENSLVVSTTFKGTRTHPQKLGTISYISEDNFLPEFFILGFM